ncbi:Cdc25 phosphatase Ibp1 [Microbotryomycetes sp. JL221]|nr:Cdc25 phosphatase Ibp1 [Microbotryomycetes sp. JL221]
MVFVSYMDHTELRDLLTEQRQPPQQAPMTNDHSKPNVQVVVVDVRDEDFKGGNIKGAINKPSQSWTDDTAIELVQQLEQVPNVVFHCALSHAQALEQSQNLTTNQPTAEQMKSFAPNPFQQSQYTGIESITTPPKQDHRPQQNVFVLRDGFEGWVDKYGNDSNLVENLRSDRIIR